MARSTMIDPPGDEIRSSPTIPNYYIYKIRHGIKISVKDYIVRSNLPVQIKKTKSRLNHELLYLHAGFIYFLFGRGFNDFFR